jgi:predicted permease
MTLLSKLITRHRHYDELSQTIREHLEEKIADLIDDGIEREEAERIARREFGNVALIEQRSREVWQWPGVENVLTDARFALRQLLRSSGFTCVAILTIGLSIGMNTAMFSVIESVLLRPLPYHDPSSIVMLWSTVPSKDIQRNWTSYPDIQDWRRESRSFTEIAAMLRVDSATLTGSEPLERIKAARVSSDFFSTLGVVPQLGRSWTADEEERRNPVVVVSHAFWQTHLGGIHNIIGKPVEIDHKRAVVIGVMPVGFDFPSAETNIWLPLSFISNWSVFLTARQADAFNAVARLKPGITPQQAQQEMLSVSTRLSDQYPQFEAGKSVSIVPLPIEIVGHRTRTSLWMLFGAVLFLLLIACANVAGLLLARQSSRERESAVRLALGASRARLIQLQLLECMILSVLAALPGLALAAAAMPILRAFGPTEIRGFAGIHLHPAILLFCLLLSLLTGLLFGFGPAWINAHRAPHAIFKAGGRTVAGNLVRRRLGKLFMVLQLALAMVLVTGAGLMLRSSLEVGSVHLGYQPHGLLFLHLDFPAGRDEAPAQFYSEVLTRIRAIPGIQNAGAIDALFSDYVPDDVIEVEGRSQLSAGDEAAASGSHIISREYFQTAGAPLLGGRSFDSTDNAHSQSVAIINQSMAARFWSGNNPVGKRFRYGVPGESPSTWRTIVGVVADTLPNGPESSVLPQFFLPQDQVPWTDSMDILVRTTQNHFPNTSDVRKAVLSVNSDVARFQISTVDDELERLGSRRRFQTWLLSAFSAVSLALAGIGIYGLILYSVAERTNEIGIRMALGATRLDIMRMILGELLTLSSVGLLIGLAGTLALSRAISSLLFGVRWADGLTLCLAMSSMLVVVVSAAYFPARRATRVNPVTALSAE